MANEVKGSVNITIGANTDVLNKAFAEAQKRANSFTTNLAKAAALGATAFITLKEGVFGTVQAFAESEAASNRLRAALLNQGMLSAELEETYNGLADQLSLLTGADDDAVKAMFASGQAMLGNIEISEQLTQAVANLAAGTGMELEDAFVKVTKTIGTKTNALAKNGFQIDANMTRQEKLAEVIRMVESRYGGQAEATRNVGTSIAVLGVQFGNLREELGARFAPVVDKVVKSLTQMIIAITNRPELLDFIGKVALISTALLGISSSVLAAKAGLTALAPVLSAASGAGAALASAIGSIGAFISASFPLITAAVAGLGAVFAGLSAPVTVAIGTILGGFAALGVGGNDLLNMLARIRESVVSTFQGVVAGMGNVLGGMMNGFAGPQMKAGLSQIVDAFFKAGTDVEKAVDDKNKAINEANRKARAAEIAEENAHFERLRDIAQVKTEAFLLQQKVGTKAQIDLKNQEAALIKQIDDETASVEVEGKRQRLSALDNMLAENRLQQVQAKIEHEQRMAEIDAAFAQATADAKALGFQADMELTMQQREQLAAMAISEQEAQRQIGFEMVKDQVERNNQFLKDKAKFGETYAKLNRAIHSDEVEAAKIAADELVGLTQSKNSALKSIGKAAALTQISISTAESAATVFGKLNAIFPLLAPAIGALGAGAIIAFGAERSAQVLAANRGGVVPGYGPNADSQLSFLTPGELVVPRQNFDEVIGSVRSSRDGGGNGDVVEAINGLSARLESRPNVVIQGDMLTDDVFIDRLISKISDRLEFGNARLVGVNA